MTPSIHTAVLLCLSSLGLAADEPRKPARADLSVQRHRGTICSLAFSPDGKTLASGGEDNLIVLSATADLTEQRRLEEHKGRVSALAFSPDGKLLASGGGDGVVCLWDAASGKLLHRCEAKVDWIMAVSFSPDGKTLAAGDYDHSIHLWDVASGKQLMRLSGHDEAVSGVSFAPDGKTLASGDYQGVVRVWETASGKELFVGGSRRRRREVVGLAYCSGGRALASLVPGGMVQFWKPPTGAVVDTFRVDSASCLGCSADGKGLIVGSLEGSVVVLEADAAREILWLDEAQRTPRGALRAVALSAAADRAAAGGKDGRLYLWSVVELLREGRATPEKLKEGDLQSLWKDLADTDATAAARALAMLAARPEQALPLFKAKLSTPPVRDRDRLLKLIDKLDDDLFAERQAASKELEATLPASAPVLQEALAATTSAEVRLRLQKLLAAFKDQKAGESLRERRAVQFLERVGGAEARELLKALAKGTSGPEVAEDAAAALRRLAQR